MPRVGMAPPSDLSSWEGSSPAAAATPPSAISVVNTWDPVSSLAFSEGELLGDALIYDETEPSALASCTKCRASKDAAACESCSIQVHSVDRYYDHVTRGPSPQRRSSTTA